jgi:hypothetical protein
MMLVEEGAPRGVMSCPLSRKEPLMNRPRQYGQGELVLLDPVQNKIEVRDSVRDFSTLEVTSVVVVFYSEI